MAHLRFTPEERREHARKPPRAVAASFGEPLPERVSRGIVLARLANFAGGHAAIAPDLAEAVAALLDGGRLPPVPALGNGASVATHPRGRFAPPKAGFFCAVASLRPFADAQASPCGARLATAQNNPGQTIPSGRIML